METDEGAKPNARLRLVGESGAEKSSKKRALGLLTDYANRGGSQKIQVPNNPDMGKKKSRLDLGGSKKRDRGNATFLSSQFGERRRAGVGGGT